jgi:hypothetical protein
MFDMLEHIRSTCYIILVKIYTEINLLIIGITCKCASKHLDMLEHDPTVDTIMIY